MRKLLQTIGLSALVLLMSGCAVPRLAPSLESRNTSQELVDKGVAALRAGDISLARAAFEAAAEVAPISSALDGLGVVAFLEGDYEVAIQLFKAAYHNGAYPTALGNLALVYESQGRLTEAKQLYEQAIAEGPTNFRARSNYAVFLSEYLGEAESAKRELLKAKAIRSAPIISHNEEHLSPNFNLD